MQFVWNQNLEDLPYQTSSKYPNNAMANICKVVKQKDNGDACKVIQLLYMDIGTPKFLDYLRPWLKDFVTHNFTVKWQDKVELPCLILPFKIFEGPLQVLHMCKLLYIGQLTYKFSVFYRPFHWDCA
jgi:hypothetical protein